MPNVTENGVECLGNGSHGGPWTRTSFGRLGSGHIAVHRLLPFPSTPPHTWSGPALQRLDLARRPSTVTTAVSMRIYQLDRVQTPASMAPGRMRVIEVEDLDLLVEWMSAFGRDTHVGAVDSDVRAAAQHRIDERSVFIWEDGGAVSMVAYAGPTPNGIRINLVYTPPHLRGRGYASGCVATLSQRLLDAGRSFPQATWCRATLRAIMWPVGLLDRHVFQESGKAYGDFVEAAALADRCGR